MANEQQPLTSPHGVETAHEPTAANDMEPRTAYLPSSSTQREIDLGIQVSTLLLKELLGAISLPIKVNVDIKFLSESGEPESSEKQVVWLRQKDSKFCALCIPEPLLHRITSYCHATRHLSLDENSEPGSIPSLVLKLSSQKEKAGPSIFTGVQFHGGKWQVRIKNSLAKNTTNLGCFPSEIEAARVYDCAAYYLRGIQAKLNFPHEEHMLLTDELKAKLDGRSTEDAAETLEEQVRETPVDGSMSARGSWYRGVLLNKQGKKWEARMNIPGKNLYLGCFTSEVEAARIYDSVCYHLRGERWRAKLNFPEDEPVPLTEELKAKLEELVQNPAPLKVPSKPNPTNPKDPPPPRDEKKKTLRSSGNGLALKGPS